MILPRPTPLASVSTMSKASMPGWASRNCLASSVVEPEGDVMIELCLPLVSCRKKGRNLAEGADQAVDLAGGRRRRDQHHVVERRDQHATVDQRDVDRGLE